MEDRSIGTASMPPEAKQWVSRILKHWGPVTALLTFLGGLVGIASLFTLHHAIGRPDLFMDALNNKSALLAWLFAVLIITSVNILVLAGTSVTCAIGISFFNNTPHLQRYVVSAMVLIVGSGYLVFAILLAYFGDAWILLFAFMTPVLVGILAFRFVRPLQEAVTQATLKPNNTSESRAGFTFSVMIFVLFTVVCGVFPYQLLLIGDAINDQNKFYTALFIFIAMMLPLTPAFVFYCFPLRLLARYAFASLAAVLQFFLLIAIAPGLFASITYAAAGQLDMRQREAHDWLLQDALAPQLFDQKAWHWTSPASGVIRVKAVQLYTFGDILLLCPAALAKTSLKTWPEVSAQCVKTKVSTSRVMSDAESQEAFIQGKS